MPTNAINDTGVKYLYDKLHGEIEPIAEAVSDSEVTIEGNPLSFNTLSSQNAKSTILSVEPIQDLHGYDKPWVGGAGKNLYIGSPNFDEYTNLELWTKETEKYNGHDVYSNTTNWRGLYKLITLKAGTYTFSVSAKTTVEGTKVYFYGVGSTSMGNYTLTTSWNKYSVTFTLNEETSGIGLRVETNVDTPKALYVSEYQLEKASTATSYEPYENICPITGRSEIGILGCGKNLVNPNEYIDNRYMNFNGGLAVNNNYWVSGYQKVQPSTQYAVSPLMNGPFVNAYKVDKTLISSISAANGVFITTAETEYVIWCYAKTNLPYGDNTQLELGSQPTPYTAYQESNNLTISLGQTVYGGQVDVENGVLSVTYAIVDLGSLWWGYEAQYKRFFTTINDMAYVASLSAKPKFVCSAYNPVSIDDFNSDITVSGTIRGNDGGNRRVYIRDLRYTAESDFKTAVSGYILCYELATPITINLTPNAINLLKGVNNISVDDANATITLTYRDGKVATLGDLTSAVDSLDNKIEDSKILTDTVTGDKYILVVSNGVLSVEQISN